jgi:hypothetical protein
MYTHGSRSLWRYRRAGDVERRAARILTAAAMKALRLAVVFIISRMESMPAWQSISGYCLSPVVATSAICFSWLRPQSLGPYGVVSTASA